MHKTKVLGIQCGPQLIFLQYLLHQNQHKHYLLFISKLYLPMEKLRVTWAKHREKKSGMYLSVLNCLETEMYRLMMTTAMIRWRMPSTSHGIQKDSIRFIQTIEFRRNLFAIIRKYVHTCLSSELRVWAAEPIRHHINKNQSNIF